MVPITNERLSHNEGILHIQEFLEWVPAEFNVKCGVVLKDNSHNSNLGVSHLFSSFCMLTPL